MIQYGLELFETDISQSLYADYILRCKCPFKLLLFISLQFLTTF